MVSWPKARNITVAGHRGPKLLRSWGPGGNRVGTYTVQYPRLHLMIHLDTPRSILSQCSRCFLTNEVDKSGLMIIYADYKHGQSGTTEALSPGLSFLPFDHPSFNLAAPDFTGQLTPFLCPHRGTQEGKATQLPWHTSLETHVGQTQVGLYGWKATLQDPHRVLQTSFLLKTPALGNQHCFWCC